MIKSKAVKNSFWLIIEKFISIFGLVFVTSFVAKYIGPESFGKINFYSSIFVVFVTVSTWGIDVISTKRLSRNVFSGVRLLHSLKYIRLIILTFLSVPLLFYVYTFTDRLSFIFTLSLFIANVFVVQDIYTYYNDSTYQSFYNVVSNVIGVIFGLALRFVIAYLKLSPEYLSLAIVTVSLVPFLIRYFVFNARYLKEKTPAKFRHQKRYISYVMYTGASLVVSAVSVTLYINISSLLLGSLVSKEALGIYAVAATIGGAWSFVNIAVLKSFTPMLYSSKDSSEINSKCSALAWVMIFFGGVYLFFYFLFGDFLIKLLYGRDYNSAYYVGFFIVITTILSNLGQLYSRVMFYYNDFKYLMYKTFVCTLLGLAFGIVLIKKFGLYGAAINNLVVEILSLTIFNFFSKKVSIFRVQLILFDLKRVSISLKGMLKI